MTAVATARAPPREMLLSVVSSTAASIASLVLADGGGREGDLKGGGSNQGQVAAWMRSMKGWRRRKRTSAWKYIPYATACVVATCCAAQPARESAGAGAATTPAPALRGAQPGSEVRGLRSEVCGLCVSSFSAALASPPDAAALILNWSCSLSDCAAFADARVLAQQRELGLCRFAPPATMQLQICAAPTEGGAADWRTVSWANPPDSAASYVASAPGTANLGVLSTPAACLPARSTSFCVSRSCEALRVSVCLAGGCFAPRLSERNLSKPFAARRVPAACDRSRPTLYERCRANVGRPPDNSFRRSLRECPIDPYRLEPEGP
eukprot:CAMPEP_0180042004 /NCGR_PEP_ID=MMETSP0984-20121128/34481_1 /TAXON_ID=483367 /ORGANISM="non described non described, Strain CCMP 2436" /LENGTH=322 /DNA_ID=CAMNT_0021969721 /DNA_START=74 /DNA_END=1045 /DNA_ORIENTATION=-